MTKRLLAMLLAVIMIVGLLPMNVFAGTAADRTKYEPQATHTDAAHVCEHCIVADKSEAEAAAVTWTAWSDTTKLPTTDGHYYLSSDQPYNVTTASLSSGHVVLCLNGKTVTANGSSAQDRFYTLSNDGSLTILDCTAHTESDGTYKAGKLTGGSASGIMFQDNNTTTTGSLNIYDGIFQGNSRAKAGGAICVQGKGTLNIYGGEFSDNSSTESTGGAIYLNTANNVTYIEDAVFKNNTAPASNGGAIYSRKAPVTIVNSKFDGNTALNYGGAIYSENAALSVTGSEITGSVAVWSAAIHMKGAKLTLDGTKIQGNRATRTSGYGAIFLSNEGGGTSNMEVKGETIVTGNSLGAADSTAERNVYVRNHNHYIIPNGLSGNAKIGLTLEAARITNADRPIVQGTLADPAVAQYFSSDSEGYKVAVVDGKLRLVVKPDHEHIICADSSCTEHTEKIAFDKWGDDPDEKSSLPSEGSYYLTDDVTLSATYSLENAKLNLCLNGHNIYIKDGVSGRQFYVKGNAKLSITDCDADNNGQFGALMNGTSGAIMSHSSSDGAEVNLYRIGLKNNSRQSSGGTIAAQGNATFNLTDVEISGSSATVDGGVFYAEKTAKINITGGSIHDNSATGNGGVFILASAYNQLTVKGTEFKDNTTEKNGGVLYTEKTCTVNFENCTFTENHADSGEGGVAYLKTANTTFTGGTMELNTAKNGSALAVFGGTCEIDGTKIKNNVTASSYGAVHMNRVSGALSMTMKGATEICGNTTAAGAAQNVFMRNNASYINMAGLTEGANICVTMEDARMRSGYWNISADTVTAEQADLIHSDNGDYTVKHINNKARLSSGHDHKICASANCSDNHTELGWIKWTDTTKLPTTAGSYYLDVDVQLTDVTWSGNDKTINLCLNGKTVTAADGKRIVSVQEGTTLNITDCKDAGVLTGGNSTFGGAINVNAGATLNLYGGTITGNHSDDKTSGQGGAIYLQQKNDTLAGGILNMYGGAITGNTAFDGAAIYGRGGSKVNIYGGTLSGNAATNFGGAIFTKEGVIIDIENATFADNTAQINGGAVYVTGGNSVLNITGATFTDNTAENGGAILAQSTGTAVTVTDAAFSGNNATSGGAMYISKNTTLNISGGKFAGNTAKNGAAIYTAAAATIIGSAEITGNTSANNGAVYMSADAQALTLKGQVKILGNMAKGRANNLYLTGSKLISMDALAEEAKIGISVETYDRAISTENDTDYSKNFLSDSAYRIVSYKDKVLYLANSTEHTHCTCAGTAASGCEHGSIVWLAWEESDALPTKDGYFYLTKDVVMTNQIWAKNKNITICLNGHTVTAAKGKRLISVQEGTVLNITDCRGSGKLTGGNSTFGGAVNVNAGGTLNLFGGTFTGNQSNDTTPLPEKVNNMKGQGGAIYLQAGKTGIPGGVLNMYGGAISGNKASLGGGIYGSANTSLNIYGGTVSGNGAVKYGGGAYSTGGITTNIANAKFEGNIAAIGGAVYVSGSGSKLNVKNAIFKNNAAQNAAGAILAQSKGTVIDINGCTFAGNQCIGSGGAVYASSNTTLKLDNSIFTGNIAEQGASLYALRATSTVGEVTMEGNKAATTKAKPTLRAAGIYVSGGEMTIDGTTIKNNQGGSGTAITTGVAKATVDGEQVSFYPTINFVSGTISGNKGTSGGAILLQSKTVFNMKGGKISGNSASDGGAIYVSTNATFNMNGGTISGNTAKNNGGAIYALRSTLNLKSGTIKDNFAEKMGGAAFLSGAKLYQSGAAISGNKTDTGTGGGAIATGIKKDGDNKYEPYIKISGGTITDNYGKHGGGILLQGSTKTVLDMTGGKIVNNQCKVDGGAIYASTGTTLNMTGGTITGNTSKGRSGAIHHNNSTGSYTGVEIFDNSAKTSGGAMVITGVKAQVKMKNVKLYDHSAATGGTIVNQGKGKLTLEKVEIYNSTSGGSGGAIYISTNSYLDVLDSNIHDCQANNFGGALYFANHTHANVDGLTLQNNASKTEGGGIYTRGATSFFRNMKLIGNKADGNGGGFCAAYPALQGVTGMIIKPDFRTGNVMENVEFLDNQSSAQAGGLYVHKGSRINLKNAVFTGNTSAYEGSAVYVLGDFTMDGLTATGNKSATEGYAVYLADVAYDGHSYASGLNQMAGDVIVKDNQGGDMYMGETTTIAILVEGIGEKTEIHVTLASGVLTNKVQGAYHYEGGDLVYTITYGDRSLTEPEYDEALAQQGKEAKGGDAVLYVGVGVFVLAVAAVVLLLILKKKKKTPAAEAASE